MKELLLDNKTNDYLMLTQASELLTSRWVDQFGGDSGQLCILQACYAAIHGVDAQYNPLFVPPAELVTLCQQRLDDDGRFLPSMAFFEGRDSVWRYNDYLCASAEEAATIVSQAADLVLLRD